MFQKESIKKPKVAVVYNLFEYEQELYLPEAWIVSIDRGGELAHIQQKATVATIGGFDIALDEVKQQLFRLIDELQTDVIVKKFHKGRRKAPSLKEMLGDRLLAKSIRKYIHKRLDILLDQVRKHELPLSLAVERRVLVKDFLLETQTNLLTPHLYFKKTADAILYQLKLKKRERNWPLLNSDVIALTNEPKGWLVAYDQLYLLEHINGYLVKPFRQKAEVRIPAKSVTTYFQSFIMKIINKVEVNADGFDIDQYTTPDRYVLEPKEDIFTKKWILSIQVYYKNASFGWNEQRKRQTSLEINGEQIRIVQIIRDQAKEEAVLAKLADFPLYVPNEQQYYELKGEHKDPFALLEWVLKHKDELSAAGFEVYIPIIGEKPLSTAQGKIELGVEQSDTDWLDLKGRIVVGDYSFSFVKLVPYIRDNNRFYPLPDGSHFLIPEEWMTKYKGLVAFGKEKGEQLRITKSQYTLLDEAGLDQEAPEEQMVDYQPSSLLKADLRPYQLEGVRWLANLNYHGLGACLADDMGLGKTLQTIAVLLYAKEQKSERLATAEQSNAASVAAVQQLDLFAPASDLDFLQPLQALIVLPSSLLFNWENELKKFAPSLSVYQHFGTKRHKDARILRRYDVLLTTYQTALRDIELLKELDYEYIVLDESQQIKNRNSKIFKAINELDSEHKISLSGTPIENALSDLWSQMQFINQGLLGSYNFFKQAFVTPIEKHNDEDRKQELRKLVAPYLLRRTKEEVAKDLPELTTKVFYTEMLAEQRKVYEKEKSAARNYLLDNFDAKNGQYRLLLLQTLNKLRQLVNHPRLIDPSFDKESGKFNDVLHQWQTIKQSNHKVLLFSSFVKHLELYKQAFESQQTPYAWLSGSTAAKDRKREVERFQNQADVQSFLISIKAGGTGLNLTAADYVFILDPWWNPTVEQQAIARAHRIGQQNHVIAYKFITKDTIEEKILKLQEKKLQLAEDIIGKNSAVPLDKNEIDYLLS